MCEVYLFLDIYISYIIGIDFREKGYTSGILFYYPLNSTAYAEKSVILVEIKRIRGLRDLSKCLISFIIPL